MRNRRRYRRKKRRPDTDRGPQASRIPWLRLRGRRGPRQRPVDRAPQDGRQGGRTRGQARGRPAARIAGRRPHSLGNPWRRYGGQCSPSHVRRSRCSHSQRHHRKLPGDQGRTRRKGLRIPVRDRHRGSGTPRLRASAAGAQPGRGSAGSGQAFHRRFCATGDRCRGPRSHRR